MKLSDAFEYFDKRNDGIITFEEAGKGGAFHVVQGGDDVAADERGRSEPDRFQHHHRRSEASQAF
jgi:hypothetical protein